MQPVVLWQLQSVKVYNREKIQYLGGGRHSLVPAIMNRAGFIRWTRQHLWPTTLLQEMAMAMMATMAI